MNKIFLISFLVFALCISSTLPGQTRLLRNPDISATHITFVYAGDIWVSNIDGTQPRRLTTFQGNEGSPYFSPDGKQIAFTGEYDGNTDVYVLPIEGGNPKRLTFHPGLDISRGWTPDGKVLFVSGRTKVPTPTLEQFWTIDTEGGFPERLIIPRVTYGQLNTDASKLAYQMVQPWESEFRHYRGGQNNPIRIVDMSTYEVTKVPWNGSIDQKPVWIGDEVFFMSDRDTIMNVWSYQINSGTLTQRTFFTEFDTKHIESGNGNLIIENGSFLYTLDLNSGNTNKINITINSDIPWARPHWTNVSRNIQNASISPTGKRAVFSARGDIFTVPAKDGEIRNLTKSNGVADRAPAWSPDGKHISWFSDESGEYQLHYSDQYGKNLKKLALRGSSFYYDPVWSPDSKHLSFTDGDRNIWLLTISSGVLSKIGEENFDHPVRTIYPEWSSDSKWIAYVSRLKSEYNAIYLYSIDQKQSFQLTDGMSNCISPAWDKSGKYIYFLASTNYGLNVGWLDMSSIRRPQEYGVYMAVLSSKEASPLAPKSDEEEIEKPKAKEEDSKGKKDKKKTESEPEVKDIVVDMNGIDQRIIALDIPIGTYNSIQAGAEKKIYLEEQLVPANGQSPNLHEYNLEEKEFKLVKSGVRYFALSHDGKKILYQAANRSWFLDDAKPGLAAEGMLSLGNLKMEIDPKKEWRQMFKEAIRYQRDFFYVENTHGLDLKKVEETYSPWVDDVNHRADLTYIMDIIGGETVVGHSFTGGGVYPDVQRVPTGLLGADYKIVNNHYQVAKIYQGENWNQNLQSPLSGPGIDIKEGEYIVAVNGETLTGDDNFYSFFAETAGKQTVISVNAEPKQEGSREITVMPVRSEFALRQRGWMESNRKKVDELSGGKLAYVWLPNTGFGGYTNFNRYYFAQQDKEGAIIDERYNGGGYAADYIVDLLNRKLMGYFSNSVGSKQPFTSPSAAIFGPKVMVVNERAGSGGDYLPYMFKKMKIGPLVGTKTWGGLVGWGGLPPLLDGGFMGAPRWGFFNTQGEWDVENIGVTPDISVEQDPKSIIEGSDPQLEKAVEVALELLKKEAVELSPQPADPVRVLKKQGN